MIKQGIKIEDDRNGMLVPLPEILNEIENGNDFYWSILFLNVIGHLGKGISVPVFQDEILKSEKGFFISWEDLNQLANKFEQLIDIEILGCRDKSLIQRYEDEEEAYETCDIVIEMIDGGFWEVFSKDQSLIRRLGAKFEKIKYLDPDHINAYLNRKSKGLKIEDSKNTKDNLSLSAILSVINGKGYYWSILSIHAYGVGQDLTIANIQRRAEGEHGCFMRWEELQFFATKLEQVINMTILCDKAAHALRHYESLQEQCENCEIVIKRIDNSYWEIFSKDAELIEQLETRFREVEHLDPKFMKN